MSNPIFIEINEDCEERRQQRITFKCEGYNMSKTKLKHASYSIKKLMDRARLSFQTKRNYQDLLNLCIKTLDQQGFQLDHIKQLKQKHIKKLVTCWQDQRLSIATIKNRMSVLRYACILLRKSNVVLKNEAYGIGKRSYISKTNKAIKHLDLSKIKDAYIRQSLKLQQQFGLRREESIKFNVAFADKGDHIELKASWTKGGIRRIIPITTQAQRECLNETKKLCGEKSLIPQGKKFIEQRNLYDRLTHLAGMKNLHGLRHAYAQKRYLELTNQFTKGKGWKAPIDGGKSRKEMTAKQKQIDTKVRKLISLELGHSRTAIVKIYCL